MEDTDDYVKFRELVAFDVKWRLKNQPVLRDDDWMIQCYFSREKFEESFPTPYARHEWVRELEAKSAAYDHLLESFSAKEMKRIFQRGIDLGNG